MEKHYSQNVKEKTYQNILADTNFEEKLCRNNLFPSFFHEDILPPNKNVKSHILIIPNFYSFRQHPYKKNIGIFPVGSGEFYREQEKQNM